MRWMVTLLGRPIHGAIFEDFYWEGVTWKDNGYYKDTISYNDLRIPRKKIVRWALIHEDGRFYLSDNKETAMVNKHSAIACKRIEIEYCEGEYDE